MQVHKAKKNWEQVAVHIKSNKGKSFCFSITLIMRLAMVIGEHTPLFPGKAGKSSF